MISEYELPLQPSIAYYDFATTLAGVPYIFQMRWNSREGAWYMDVFEIDETPIAYGIKIVLGAYLGRRVTHPLFQRGVFAAVDLSGAKREAGFDDLGVRVIVKYIPSIDLLRRLQEAS